MELEEQIRLHKEISKKIEELEEQKRLLSQAIMQSMSEKTLQMGSYFVRRYSRLSITMTPDEARPYNAVKLEETVDKEKIKELFKQGNSIAGVKEIEYIQITVSNKQ